MERMVMFVQETDQIQIASVENLVLNERVLDTYDNDTLGYIAEGDGYLDADNDHDGVVNEGGVNDDPADPISFSLEVTKVLCAHVTTFSCTLLTPDLVEIQLTVNDGKNEIHLKTRVKAMYID
jgi:hypothetical protein